MYKPGFNDILISTLNLSINTLEKTSKKVSFSANGTSNI